MIHLQIKGGSNLEDFLLNNPALLGMDPVKLQFILDFAKKDKPTNMKDAMPFLLANMNIAKKENINFTNSEVQLIADLLCKDLPSEEQAKVKRIMSIMGR